MWQEKLSQSKKCATSANYGPQAPKHVAHELSGLQGETEWPHKKVAELGQMEGVEPCITDDLSSLSPAAVSHFC